MHMSDATDEDIDLPQLREYSVPAHGEIPSRGFITPHQRSRHEIIENITDTRTAMKLYGLVHEGSYANYEKALKAAINELYRDMRPENIRWRYYCNECGFIGGTSRTHAEAEAGSRAHANTGDCGDDVTVFAYDTNEWDPDNVESLVDEYTAATTDDE